MNPFGAPVYYLNSVTPGISQLDYPVGLVPSRPAWDSATLIRCCNPTRMPFS